MQKSDKIDELLHRGVEEIIPRGGLIKLLQSKKKLRIKLGIDPTSPNIHIGRAVVLWKLRAFQELGHKVVFIIGDYTAQIGDTSDKDAERPVLSESEVKKNLKDYLKQAFLILDKTKTETHYNSEWLKKLGTSEIIRLTDLFSLNEFQSRELIKRRVQAGKRVSMREALYPVMQGYDSVAVKADVEIGGTDQRFNLLAGRTIQPVYGQAPQSIMMLELLEGTDGRKMSSSWGNVINVTDSAKDMFGKVMSINDELIKKYFILTTRVPLKEIDQIIKINKNPRDQKIILGWELVKLYHDEDKANSVRDQFIAQFSQKQLPSDIKSASVKPGNYKLTELLVLTGLAQSKSEARRLLEQNGVKLDESTAKEQVINIGKINNLLLQVGKRKFVKIK